MRRWAIISLSSLAAVLALSILFTAGDQAQPPPYKGNVQTAPPPSDGNTRPLAKVNYIGQVNEIRQRLNNDPDIFVIDHNHQDKSHFIENEVTVKFTRHPNDQELQAICKAIDGKIKKHIDDTCIFKSQKMTTAELIDYFETRGDVRFAEPNYLLLPNKVPNDQYYREYQWNLPMLNMENSWDITDGSEDVIVAVVDTGVDLQHPDFRGKLVEGYNVLTGDNQADDDNGHGTHVAGIIAAKTNNNAGIAGISWNSKIMPVKGIGADGTGSAFDIATGIKWAADNGASVINLSVGNYSPSQVLQDAVSYAYERDVVLVAASGNDNTEQPSYPAAYPEVLAVGAVDYRGERAEFSNFGDYVDVVAPGVDIPSTFIDNQYAALSGTSMASPHVAGLAALIRSANGELSNREVMDIIRRTSVDQGAAGQDPYYGFGIINSADALTSVAEEAEQPPAAQENQPANWGTLLRDFLERLGLIRGTQEPQNR